MPLELIEVQSGGYLGEDDIVRFEDVYGATAYLRHGGAAATTCWLYVAIGFAAQLIDGALGMAYGVTASSLLLGVGIAAGGDQRHRACGRVFHHRHVGAVAPRLRQHRQAVCSGACCCRAMIGAAIGAYLLVRTCRAIRIKPWIAGIPAADREW